MSDRTWMVGISASPVTFVFGAKCALQLCSAESVLLRLKYPLVTSENVWTFCLASKRPSRFFAAAFLRTETHENKQNKQKPN